jgi:hypothetical protein
VKGTAFITVAKANGVWTITPNYLLLTQNTGVTPTQVLALQDTLTGIWTYVPAGDFTSLAASYRLITAAGAVSVLASDDILLFQKSPSGASTINLPTSATRAGSPVIIKDLTGDAHTNNLTVVPFTGETIDGFSASAAAANGTAVISVDYGFKSFYPLTSGGWYVGP